MRKHNKDSSKVRNKSAGTAETGDMNCLFHVMTKVYKDEYLMIK